MLAARTVTLENDLAAVGRKRPADIDAGRIGQPFAAAAIGRHTIYVGIAADSHGIEDVASIRAPPRCKGWIVALRDERLPTGADVIDVDTRIAVDIAEIDQLAIIRRIARRQRCRTASRNEPVVGPVAVHDGETLGAIILRACFCDIGNAAVEERALPGQARIDEVGAFVRCTAPVCRRDHPAFSDQPVLQGHVVKIAAHGQAIVAARTDIAMDQHFRAAGRPGRPVRRGDVRKGWRRKRVRTSRLEQSVVAQVGGDDPCKLHTERRRTACIGRCRDIPVGGESGNGDTEIIEITLEADRACKAALFLDCFDRLAFLHRFAEVLVLRRERSSEECERDEG